MRRGQGIRWHRTAWLVLVALSGFATATLNLPGLLEARPRAPKACRSAGFKAVAVDRKGKAAVAVKRTRRGRTIAGCLRGQRRKVLLRGRRISVPRGAASAASPRVGFAVRDRRGLRLHFRNLGNGARYRSARLRPPRGTRGRARIIDVLMTPEGRMYALVGASRRRARASQDGGGEAECVLPEETRAYLASLNEEEPFGGSGGEPRIVLGPFTDACVNEEVGLRLTDGLVCLETNGGQECRDPETDALVLGGSNSTSTGTSTPRSVPTSPPPPRPPAPPPPPEEPPPPTSADPLDEVFDATQAPELIACRAEPTFPSGTVVTFRFDEEIADQDPTPFLLHLVTEQGVSANADSVDVVGGTGDVLAFFPTTSGPQVCTADAGAVLDPDGVANPTGAGRIAGGAGSTDGLTARPDLRTLRVVGTTDDRRVRLTFDASIAALLDGAGTDDLTAADVRLVLTDGSALTPTACSGGALRPVTGDGRSVDVCFGGGTLPVDAALVTVDDDAHEVSGANRTDRAARFPEGRAGFVTG